MELDSLLLERRVDALLAPWTERKGPGVALGVVRKGELVLHRGAGLASIEHGVPAGPGTRFRIASVSKQFTCAAILMLREEGKLSLDDPARRHLPKFRHRVGTPCCLSCFLSRTGIKVIANVYFRYKRTT